MEFDYTEMYNAIRKCCNEQPNGKCPVKNQCVALWNAMKKLQEPPIIQATDIDVGSR